MSEAAIESEIQAKSLNAPRLTPQLIDSLISAERYLHCGGAVWSTLTVDGSGICARDVEFDIPTTLALTCLTICVLVLRNGYTVVGKSACASPSNFDPELGRKIAREDARRQIWALESYLLRSHLAEAS